MRVNGSCLCGAVAYELDAPVFSRIDSCHCSNCRKAHGAAFGTYAIVDTGAFRWVTGEDCVSRFESSANTYRSFCNKCGSPLAAFNGDELRGITLGTVDGDPGIRPKQHMYVSSKAPWFEITDDLPQFAKRGDDVTEST